VRAVGGFEGDDEGGRRNGRAPEGEAWLFEGTMSTSTPAILKKVCVEEM
jgi:hypothetical protein